MIIYYRLLSLEMQDITALQESSISVLPVAVKTTCFWTFVTQGSSA